jgi:3-dehydroquinate dehydratase-2
LPSDRPAEAPAAASPLRVGVLHGPNLDLLGRREPETYGRASLAEIDSLLQAHATALGVTLTCHQSNHEGVLVEQIHAAANTLDGLVLNLAAYTHTSIAIRDALAAVAVPFVEVHLSNLHAREAFRQQSMVADLAIGVVQGFGPDSYLFGLEGLVRWLTRRKAR